MQRTPKHYDGILSPSKKLGDLLPEFLRQIDQARAKPNDALFRAWPELVGPSIALRTQVHSFTSGVFMIVVKSSVLYGLLCQCEKPRLLKALQTKFPHAQIRDLVFRMG